MSDDTRVLLLRAMERLFRQMPSLQSDALRVCDEASSRYLLDCVVSLLGAPSSHASAATFLRPLSTRCVELLAVMQATFQAARGGGGALMLYDSELQTGGAYEAVLKFTDALLRTIERTRSRADRAEE